MLTKLFYFVLLTISSMPVENVRAAELALAVMTSSMQGRDALLGLMNQIRVNNSSVRFIGSGCELIANSGEIKFLLGTSISHKSSSDGRGKFAAAPVPENRVIDILDKNLPYMSPVNVHIDSGSKFVPNQNVEVVWAQVFSATQNAEASIFLYFKPRDKEIENHHEIAWRFIRGKFYFSDALALNTSCSFTKISYR